MNEIRKEEKEWYDNPNMITTMLIAVSILVIILSQSFAIRNHLDAGTILRSIINYNSFYLLALVYFILIKTKIGRRYFPFLNILISIFFCLITVASTFTIFLSFGLTSVVDLALNLVLTIYFIYVFIHDTVIGTELKMKETPMDEVNNSQYFYAICGLVVVALVVSLIGANTFDEVVLALLDSIYYALFARYIFLYKEFQDKKKLSKRKKNKKIEKKEDSIVEEEKEVETQTKKKTSSSKKVEKEEEK